MTDRTADVYSAAAAAAGRTIYIDCQVKQKSARSEFIRFRSNVNHQRLPSYLFDLFGQTVHGDRSDEFTEGISFFSRHINRLGVPSINKNKLKLFLFAVVSGGNLIIFCAAIRLMSDGPSLFLSFTFSLTRTAGPCSAR